MHSIIVGSLQVFTLYKAVNFSNYCIYVYKLYIYIYCPANGHFLIECLFRLLFCKEGTVVHVVFIEAAFVSLEPVLCVYHSVIYSYLYSYNSICTELSRVF